MTVSESTLKGEVLFLTDYGSFLSDSEVDEAVEIAKRQVKAQSEVYDIDFYEKKDYDAYQALKWTTCLALKFKAGEIDSADFQLDELDFKPKDSQGNNEGTPVYWLIKSKEYIKRIRQNDEDTNKVYGTTRIARGERIYGDIEEPESTRL